MARNQLPGPFPFRFLYWRCPQYPFHMPSLNTRLRRPCKGAGASQREVRWVCRSLPLSSAAVRPQVIYILPDPTHDHTRMIFAPLEFAVTVLLHVLVPHALLTRWVVSFRPALPPLSRHLYSIESDRWGTPNQEAGTPTSKLLPCIRYEYLGSYQSYWVSSASGRSDLGFLISAPADSVLS